MKNNKNNRTKNIGAYYILIYTYTYYTLYTLVYTIIPIYHNIIVFFISNLNFYLKL